MFRRILVLCTGNICRSPMAEALLRRRLQAGGRDVAVRSAGLGALEGHPADETVCALMREKGVDLSAHRGRQLTSDLLHWAELILVMEGGQQRVLQEMYPIVRGRVFLLGHWRNEEIPDPYRQETRVYRYVAGLVERAVQDWVDKI